MPERKREREREKDQREEIRDTLSISRCHESMKSVINHEINGRVQRNENLSILIIDFEYRDT